MSRSICLFRTTVFAVAAISVLDIACTQRHAQQNTAEAPPPSPRSGAAGDVHIQEASRQFIEVQEVSAAKSDSAIVVPARVDFRDGAVSQVGAPLDGRVVTVHVLIGQRVAAGSPLVTLDCADAASMRASAAVAESSLREARLELDRQRRMQNEGVGVERDLIAAETRVSAAEAELGRVQSGAASIGPGNGATVVVRSPIDGVVIARKATVGMAVQHGADALVEIGDASALWIVADVFERDLPHVHPGASGVVTLSSIDRQLEGRVTSIGNIVAPGLRTVPVYLAVDARGTPLRPGMFGRVAIDSADGGITLPVEAVLIKEGKDPVVYVQKDALTFVARPVQVAQPVGSRVQIVSGLSAGEKVVVHGALLLDGAADQLL